MERCFRIFVGYCCRGESKNKADFKLPEKNKSFPEPEILPAKNCIARPKNRPKPLKIGYLKQIQKKDEVKTEKKREKFVQLLRLS
jgi:hypothetical protein